LGSNSFSEAKLTAEIVTSNTNINTITTPTVIPPVTANTTAPAVTQKKPIDREIKVFPPSEKEFDPKEFEVPDDFYDITSEDYQTLAQADKQKRLKEREENALLKTKMIRQHEYLTKMRKFRKTMLRIRFPNRIELQGTFSSLEKTEDVYQFVKSHITFENEEFYLFTAPPFKKLEPKVTLLNQLLVPAVIIHFSWEDKRSVITEFLTPSVMAQLQDKLPVNWTWTWTPVIASQPKPIVAEQEHEKINEPTEHEPMQEDDSKEKKKEPAPKNFVPKWFKGFGNFSKK